MRRSRRTWGERLLFLPLACALLCVVAGLAEHFTGLVTGGIELVAGVAERPDEWRRGGDGFAEVLADAVEDLRATLERSLPSDRGGSRVDVSLVDGVLRVVVRFADFEAGTFCPSCTSQSCVFSKGLRTSMRGMAPVLIPQARRLAERLRQADGAPGSLRVRVVVAGTADGTPIERQGWVRRCGPDGQAVRERRDTWQEYPAECGQWPCADSLKPDSPRVTLLGDSIRDNRSLACARAACLAMVIDPTAMVATSGSEVSPGFAVVGIAGGVPSFLPERGSAALVEISGLGGAAAQVRKRLGEAVKGG